MITQNEIAHTAIIGDVDPESETCTVDLYDAYGREIRTIEAPEDDLIPYMLMLGYRLGVYLGNGKYQLR